MEKWILINGASSDIGKELAIEFAQNGCNLFLVGQNSFGLKETIAKSCSKFGVETEIIDSDFSNFNPISKLNSSISEKNFEAVVNYSDFNFANGKSERNPDDELRMMSEQFFAICKLTKSLVPKMIRAKRGKILNVVPMLKGEIFKTYKSALLSFSLALGNELSESSVSVAFVSPKSKS